MKDYCQGLRVALVHDYLIRSGGAERVLFELHKLFPQAPIYTLLHNEEKMSGMFDGAEIKTSFLQKLPKFLKKRHKYLLPLLPLAAENFDLRDYDLVLSSSSAFAKAVITRPDTLHICYCHAPSRFLWDWSHEYLKEQDAGLIRKIFAIFLVHYLRVWDRSSAKRVDYFIANSKATQRKINKYYRTNAFVIYPCVDYPSLEEFKKIEDGNYFLIVSQLTPYKRVDVAVEAFNKLKLPLVVIGDGPEKEYLKNIAGSNVKIIGWVDEEEKKQYLKNCAAFIFAGEDDFGIAPVEAMGWGKPVLALRIGGALETVLEGVTGEFFDASVPEVLADGVRRLRANLAKYSPLVIRKWAEKFSVDTFRREIMDFLNKKRYNKEDKTKSKSLI